MTLAALAGSQERGVGYVKGSKNALYDGPPRPSLDSTASEGHRTDLTNNPGYGAGIPRFALTTGGLMGHLNP